VRKRPERTKARLLVTTAPALRLAPSRCLVPTVREWLP